LGVKIGRIKVITPVKVEEINVYSQDVKPRSSKGSVQVLVSNGRLQLRFRYGGKRHYLSLGLSADDKRN
jgi:hypothetical protein